MRFPKRGQKWVMSACLVALIFVYRSAYSIDPFTIISTVGTAVSVVSSISDTASEVASSVDAFSELYSEVDGDAEVSQDGTVVIGKIRELEELAREAGYSKDEIEGLLETDRKELQSLSGTIRRITQAIRTGKRIARLISKLDKKAQVAQVETAAIEREQLRVQYRMLGEQLDQRISEKKKQLLSAVEKRNQMKVHAKEIAERGGRVFGRTGIYSFPKIDRVVEKAVEFAAKMRPVFLGLILLVFLLRVVYYQFGLFGPNKYGELIRDVIICALLMAIFPELIHASLGISRHLSEKIAFGHASELQMPESQPELKLTALSTSVALYLLWLSSWIKYGAFIIADFIFNFGLAFLVILFPLVIFASQMLNLTLAWTVFLASFLMLSLWPFFWNATGMLARELWSMNTNSVSDNLKTLLFSLLQLVSPFVTMLVLRGQSVGQAVRGTVQSVSRVLTRGVDTVRGASRAARGKPGGAFPGRILGAVGSYPVRQIASRSAAIHSRMQESVRDQKKPDSTGLMSGKAKAHRTVAAGMHGFVWNEGKTPSGRTTSSSTARLIRGLSNKRNPERRRS